MKRRQYRKMKYEQIDLSMDEIIVDSLLVAARDTSPVDGLTHNHYRYPARFSPRFVRAVIELFTEPGDLVLDPFMGGGTTLVEALALRRNAIGIDISSLAAFVSEVKTTLLSDRDVTKLRAWAKHLPEKIHMHRRAIGSALWEEQGYQKHLASKQTWRLRKAIEQALLSALNLRPIHLEPFARCIILRTAQWALDSRRKTPTVQEFRHRMVESANTMLDGTLELRRSALADTAYHHPPSINCLNRSVIGMEDDNVIASLPPPKLVLTSPPYPGIHVLYHRWQVDGRKETPAPFWIANKLDGASAKFYTMGDRKETGLRTYYENLRASFCSIRRLCDQSTTIVQMIAFAQPDWQLARYLNVIEETGFDELLLPGIDDSADGRLWRDVPNRRWHADQMGQTSGSREVVLVHRVAPVTRLRRHFPTDSLDPRPTH